MLCITSHSFQFVQFDVVILLFVSPFTTGLVKQNKTQYESDSEQRKSYRKANNNTTRNTTRTIGRVGRNKNTQTAGRLRNFLVNSLTRSESLYSTFNFNLNRTEISTARFHTIKHVYCRTRFCSFLGVGGSERKRSQEQSECST